jgi:serine/threonine protein kinase
VIGETLRGGRYLLERRLGEGAQGTTFSALDRVTMGHVAVKKFEVRGAKHWKDVELAEREARVLSSLTHPKLPKYVEHFEEAGALYLVMEEVEGQSLRTVAKSGTRFSERDAVRLLADLNDVLSYLHGASPPIVHRDIKPNNVIRKLDGSFALVLVDFGSVRDRLRPEGGSTVVGTFGFMAPEQFQGRAFPASDVYAVGATCVSMMTGSEPENLPHRGLRLDVRAALAHCSDRALVDALERMLDPDPDTRPTRIADVLDGIRVNGEPIEPAGWGSISSPQEGMPRWMRAMFWIAWAMAWPVVIEIPAITWFWVFVPFIGMGIARTLYPKADKRAQKRKRKKMRKEEQRRMRVEDHRRVRDAEWEPRDNGEEDEADAGDAQGSHDGRRRRS